MGITYPLCPSAMSAARSARAGYVPQLDERGLVMPAEDGERAEVEWTLAYGFRGVPGWHCTNLIGALGANLGVSVDGLR